MVSGAGFASKSKYLFGKVSIQIKLVEGDSAGTVTAFYVRIHYNSADNKLNLIYLINHDGGGNPFNNVTNIQYSSAKALVNFTFAKKLKPGFICIHEIANTIAIC